ncbi:MAG: corrinoid protein [Christensenellaceae bacterium]|nr:corrinoid protein [Christensenellaceae bacterium]
MAYLDDISEYLQQGKAKKVKQLTLEALAKGCSPNDILNHALLKGMMAVAEKYRDEKIYVPEVIVASGAFNAGMEVLEPVLSSGQTGFAGKTVIGTVEGDIHDIGKNILKIMLKGAGFEITDLGTDVSAKEFIDAAESIGADMICLSALLTTTMMNIKEVIEEAVRRGVRDKYIIMIGGAPVTDKFCEEVGADIYASDAASGTIIAKEEIGKRREQNA